MEMVAGDEMGKSTDILQPGSFRVPCAHQFVWHFSVRIVEGGMGLTPFKAVRNSS
jgi:hypothetical protein